MQSGKSNSDSFVLNIFIACALLSNGNVSWYTWPMYNGTHSTNQLNFSLLHLVCPPFSLVTSIKNEAICYIIVWFHEVKINHILTLSIFCVNDAIWMVCNVCLAFFFIISLFFISHAFEILYVNRRETAQRLTAIHNGKFRPFRVRRIVRKWTELNVKCYENSSKIIIVIMME